LHSLIQIYQIMKRYIISNVYSYEVTCEVEAETLEEALRNAEIKNEYQEGEHLLELERYKELDLEEYEHEDEDGIQELLEEADWEVIKKH